MMANQTHHWHLLSDWDLEKQPATLFQSCTGNRKKRTGLLSASSPQPASDAMAAFLVASSTLSGLLLLWS